MVKGNMIEAARESTEFFLFAMAELTVLFIGISFLVGCINTFLPEEKVKKLLSGRQGRGYIIGAILGGLTPFCSCSTIPMMVGLLKAGAGFGPTMTFLFTSPLVNPVLLGLFFTLLGTKITVVYSILALSLAVISGKVLEKFGFYRYVRTDVFATKDNSCGCKEEQPQVPVQALDTIAPLVIVNEEKEMLAGRCCESAGSYTPYQQSGRWKIIFTDAVGQFKKFLPFILLGVAIGSLIHGFVPARTVSSVAGADNVIAVPLSALVGIPLYIRASTMLPIASSLIAKGMNLGAVIALIIGGAGASLPEVAMLNRLFRIPLLLAFLLSVFFTAVISGFIMNGVIP